MKVRALGVAAVVAAAGLAPRPAEAFWLLNFQTAPTLPAGGVGFIGGTGAQLTRVGEPGSTSFTPYLAHFGLRVGLADFLDVGYRLCTVPLPYSSAGPTLGAELDVKARLTPASWTWQAALVAGVGDAWLELGGASRSAWSPGVDLVVSRALGESVQLALNGRYVFTAIPTAAGGAEANDVTAAGGSAMLRFAVSPVVAVQVELGAFDFLGALGGKETNGWGLQAGVVFAARLR